MDCPQITDESLRAVLALNRVCPVQEVLGLGEGPLLVGVRGDLGEHAALAEHTLQFASFGQARERAEVAGLDREGELIDDVPRHALGRRVVSGHENL